MNYPKQKNLMKAVRQATVFTLLALICLAGMPANTSAQVGSSNNEDFQAGTIIIPMDNALQGADGSCNGPAFNLKAYGLVARLLHNNIPVKWAIANGKLKDGTDFIANATRYDAPGTASDSQNCNSGPSNFSFTGGPLLIRPEFSASALTIINAFNAEITATTPFNTCSGSCDATETAENRVRVYIANDVGTAGGVEFSAPIRYTLGHKPLVAVGPDAVFGGPQGGYREKIHQRLFDYAKLASNACTSVNNGGVSDTNWGTCTTAGYAPYYAPVTNETINTNSCYTLATQAHASDGAAMFSSQYTAFAQNGGNVLFQCRSVRVFENGVTVGSTTYPGQFYQSNTPGWSLYGVVDVGAPLASTAYEYLNGAAPFSQFVTNLVLNQPGYVEEFGASSSAYNARGDVDLQPVVSNTGAGSNPDWWANVHVGTVSDLTPGVGGNVFELGGHDYFMANTSDAPVPNAANLARLNGQRMILNAILTPSSRPGCGLQVPVISGFKQVQTNFAPGDDVAPIGFINPNDIATWTIRYINTSPVPVSNFQIVDPLQTGLQFVGPLVVTATTGSTATANGSYTGSGANTNLLAPGAYLEAGGKIEVRIRTTLTSYTTYLNHPTAFGNGLDAAGIKTDTVDITNTGTVGGYPRNSCNTPANAPCYPQDDWQTANLDPTGILLVGPSAAPVYVEGRVIGSNGRGIQRTTITLRNAVSGEERVATTNTFGYFRFDDLTVGDLYIMSPFNKQYAFPSGDMTFTLDDNLDGVTFVGVPRVRGESIPETKVNVTKMTWVAEPLTKRSVVKKR